MTVRRADVVAHIRWSGIRGASSLRRWRERDRGSGTVLLLAVVGVLAVVAATIGLLAAAQSARGRAQSAADLAALAAASAWQDGWGDPCSIAAVAVRRNAARLASCEALPGGVVVVGVSVWSPAGAATAEARAGPS
ncbi:MAG: Rv3654c family TadE-like protein, partial [Brevundimonas sp.]